MKWQDAISILALAASAGILAVTATGALDARTADGNSPPPPSLPIAVAADGQQARLDTLLGDGEVGVITVAPRKAAQGNAAPPRPESPPPVPKSSPKTAPRIPLPCVNINTAAAPALTALKGIGPATAASIIEYRKAHGPFKQKEDIMKVKGIGPAKFANIEGRICL